VKGRHFARDTTAQCLPHTFLTMQSLIGFLTIACLACVSPQLFAQGSQTDYARSAALDSRTRNKVLNASVDFRWLTPTTLSYSWNGPDGSLRYESVDAATGKRQPLFDHTALATQLQALLSSTFDPARLPIDEIASVSDGVAILLSNHTRPIVIRDQKAHFLSDDEPNPFLIAPLPAPARSVQNARKASSLIFVNNLDIPVTIFWIDADLKRRQYASINPGQAHRQGTFQGHAWVVCDPSGKDLRYFAAEARSGIALISPQQTAASQPTTSTPQITPAAHQTTPSAAGRASQVFIRDRNIWLRPDDGTDPLPLTTDGTDTHPYTSQIITSPDAQFAIVVRSHRPTKRKVYYVESSPPDQLQPKLHSYEYPKPGDELDAPQPVLVDIAARQIHTFDTPLLDNPWSVDRFVWTTDSSRCLFVYNQRGHQVQRVLCINTATRTLSSVLEERSATFIDYSQKTYFHYLPDADAFIWMSERSGYNHLYRVHAQTGAVSPITRGDWVVRAVDNLDRDRHTLTLKVMGIHPDQDPYHVHFARVGLDGSGFTLLTQGDGTHSMSPSPNGDFLIDTYSRADLPPVTELRRAADGTLIVQLVAADWAPLRAAGWISPQRFVAKGRDGTTDIWGLIHRPTNFDPKLTYPVIEAIYAGPHGQHVPKDFRVHSRSAELAELGFIVVQIDGMGTNWRSKAFHDVAWKNLSDAGFPDRRAWLTAAASAHPQMDLINSGRGVGIFGGSAGGQNALAALLWHGDFYKVAAADCGCHDNRMDKVWWTEAWMSWPVGSEYEQSSNVAHAHRLPDDAHLLLTVGEMDENVDPASTMQVANALIRANKDFDLIVLPGLGHGAGESPYAARRRADFFVRHLMGKEPRWLPK